MCVSSRVARLSAQPFRPQHAERKRGAPQVVFTRSPVGKPNSGRERRFEIRIDKHGNSYAGSLRVGFTATNPASLRQNVESDSQHISRSWIVDGKQIIACGATGQRTYPSLADLSEGNQIAIICDTDGCMRLEYDGEDQGLAEPGLPVGEELWGVVDLYGQCDGISIVESGFDANIDPTGTIDRLEHAPIRLGGALRSKLERVVATDCGTCALASDGSVHWWGQKPWPLRLLRAQILQSSNTASKFEAAYEEYIRTIDDHTLLIGKSEMITLLANDSKFRERVRAVGSSDEGQKKKDKKHASSKGPKRGSSKGSESATGTAMMKLKGVYRMITGQLHPGTKVMVHSSSALHPPNSIVMLQTAFGPKLYKLQRPVLALDDEPVDATSCTRRKATRKIDLRGATFVSRGFDAEEGTILQVDVGKGIAVVRPSQVSPWLTAAVPMENPCCSCKLTRVGIVEGWRRAHHHRGRQPHPEGRRPLRGRSGAGAPSVASQHLFGVKKTPCCKFLPQLAHSCLVLQSPGDAIEIFSAARLEKLIGEPVELCYATAADRQPAAAAAAADDDDDELAAAMAMSLGADGGPQAAASEGSSTEFSMLQYYDYGVEPSLHSHYRSTAGDGERRKFEVHGISAGGWKVFVTLRERDTVYRYTCDLNAGTWDFVPMRCADVGAASNRAGSWGFDTETQVRAPITWTILQNDGPDHLGLRCGALTEHQMALITSDCAPSRNRSSKWTSSVASAPRPGCSCRRSSSSAPAF